MDIFNYCNQCKKSLKSNNFDKKKNGNFYTRCKSCRINHNKHEKEKYIKKKCSTQTLCNDNNCKKCFSRSFASFDGVTTNEKLKIDCWNPNKNGKLMPRDVFKSSSKKYWFKCDVCKHDFDGILANISKNRWCPYCSGGNLCNDNCKECFSRSFASYDAVTTNEKLKIDCWNPNKNGKLMPRDVFKLSNKKYWFKCDVCKHDFDSVLNSISGLNCWCPYCSGKNLCNDNCKKCFSRSFASYNGKTINSKLKIDCWHPDKNGKLIPRNVFKSSHKKCWFKCDVCKHNFYGILNDVSNKNRWCPYCSGKKLCKDNCKKCFSRSFASYDGKTMDGLIKIDCWHPDKNGELTPRDIAKSSHKKCWFKCNFCKHDFDSTLNNVSSLNCWCPYCSSKNLCNDNCIKCFSRSFASYNGKTINNKLKIDCWHPDKNGKLMPRNVFKSSDKKCWFKCDVCNYEFKSFLKKVYRNNQWCPHCKNKTELKLYKWLLKHDKIKNVKREFDPKWCSTQYRHMNKKKELKNGKYQYRFDFLITFNNNQKLIIELDGRQHFEQVRNWKTPLEHQIRDKYKEFKANKHNIPLMRCIQEDVYMDKNKWEVKLKTQLQKYY